MLSSGAGFLLGTAIALVAAGVWMAPRRALGHTSLLYLGIAFGMLTLLRAEDVISRFDFLSDLLGTLGKFATGGALSGAVKMFDMFDDRGFPQERLADTLMLAIGAAVCLKLYWKFREA